MRCISKDKFGFCLVALKILLCLYYHITSRVRLFQTQPSRLTYISGEHHQQVARELVFPEGRHYGTDCVIHRRHHAYKQEVRHQRSLMADRV